jgi:flavin reductase (DIM6/NTAB) family NADH-FMN oxidoreductase RutF
MDVTPTNIRKVMGHFATGVCVITARMPNGSPCGVTINSFTSVSLDPPLVLFCLSHTSAVFSAFQAPRAGPFLVHILAASQEHVSQHMTVHSPDFWQNTPFVWDEENCPQLEGCVARVRCHHHAQFDGGDHTIFVGRMVAMRVLSEELPLLYYRGAYRQLRGQLHRRLHTSPGDPA